jgi:glycosyltransferase involved in cell wall biosynthesis
LPKYFNHIYQHMSISLDVEVFQAIRSENRIKEAIMFPTYNSNMTFLLASILILPILLLFFSSIVIKNIHKKKIVYFPYFHLWAFPIIIIANFFRIRTVFTVHDAVHHDGEGGRFEKWLLRQCIERATHLIFLTEFVKLDAYSNYNIDSPATVIPHGLFEFSGLKENNSDEIINFLFFGRVSKYKGIEMLLDAVSKSEILKSKNWSVVGKSNYKVFYEKYEIPNLNIVDRFVSDDEISKFFSEADVLVLPYKEATQSGVASIAVQSTIATVVTNVGGLEEQVPSNCAIYCDPNSESLKNALLRVINNKELRLEKKRNMLELKDSYSWLSISIEISNVLYKQNE